MSAACQNVAVIDEPDEATAEVHRWLEATATHAFATFSVVGTADIGPAWRVLYTYQDRARPWMTGWTGAARIDKASGDVFHDDRDPLKTGPSARESFIEMMRSTVRPELRRLGFVGKGTKTFTWPSETHFATLSFEQAADNRWIEAKFAVNLAVCSHEEWEKYRGRTGSSLTQPPPDARIAWHERLGRLHYGTDHWWSIWAGFPTDSIADDLIDSARELGLPAILAHLDDD